jgi:hypothetical protein
MARAAIPLFYADFPFDARLPVIVLLDAVQTASERAAEWKSKWFG